MRGGTASQVSRGDGFVEGVNDEGDTAVPSPLVGEGGSPRSGETREGYLSAKEHRSSTRRKPPHPALRAIFSHKGRRKRTYSDIGLSEMSQSLPVKVEMKSCFIRV